MRTVLSTVGVLQQALIGVACAAIAAGSIRTALVAGGDAGYRILRSRITGAELPKPDQGGTPDEVLAPKEDLRHEAEIRAGLRMPVGLYAIIESAFRARRGVPVAAHRDQVAALYSRFTSIAAANPAAWTRTHLAPAIIRDASARNPMQAFPYTKLLCSSWNVDQAAALLFCSARKAEELGIPRDRWVFPWASTESNHMVPVCARAELDSCPGAGIAGRAALEPFGLGAGDVDLIELYSCFPVAVEAYAAALGIPLDRDLTVTGGMPSAGGPYNNYVLQATCRMAELLRGGNATTGLVGSVSGIITKQGFGLWSTRPPPQGFRFADVTDAVAQAASAKPVALDPANAGQVAGYTVLFDRAHPPRGVIVADLGRWPPCRSDHGRPGACRPDAGRRVLRRPRAGGRGGVPPCGVGAPMPAELMHDVCTLPLARRVAALLDRDPDALQDGGPLPRGWHVALFTVPTRQSQLRSDGLAGLGVALPDLGLPRIVAGGKRTRFTGDIPIGAAVRRESRTVSVTPKQGRSGRLAVVVIEHAVLAEGQASPVLTEQQDYVMLQEKTPGAPAPASPPAARADARYQRQLVPDVAMLLRYCAITFNTHRIHYDLPYATAQEGYPALVVNGGLPLLFLLELFRAAVGREPDAVATRNLAPLYCGRPMRLCATAQPAWRLWAEDEAGRVALEVQVE